MNPEKAQEYQRKWWLANPEYQRKWRLANPEKVREQTRRWNLENPERKREAERRWKLANPDKRRLYQARRKARKADTMVNLRVDEVNTIIRGGCFFSHLGDCNGPLTLAHDVPISKGGNTTEANIFCLCRRHNSQMQRKTLAEIFGQLTFLERRGDD